MLRNKLRRLVVPQRPVGRGDGDDEFYGGDVGNDALYGGARDDLLVATMDRQKDKLFCGEGRDHYDAEKGDYVSSSCEEKQKRSPIP